MNRCAYLLTWEQWTCAHGNYVEIYGDRVKGHTCYDCRFHWREAIA